MKNENIDFCTDVATLQQLVKDLQQQCKSLTEDAQRKEVIQHQQKAELERLYQQVTGESLKSNWSLRDYAVAVYTYLDNIIALAPGHIFWQDRNHVFLGCNNAHAKAANLASRHMIVGKTNADLPWKEQAASLEAANKQVLESGKTIILEEPADTVYGYQIYLSQKVPLINESGEIIGLLGTAMDITEQKQAQEAIRHAKQQIEAANRARSEFLHRIQQELQPILMDAVNCAQDLLQHEKQADKRHQLNTLYQVSARVLKLFNTIIHYDEVLDAQPTFEFSTHMHENITPIELDNVLEGTQEKLYMLEQKVENQLQQIERLLQENQQMRAVNQRETGEFTALYQQITGQPAQPRLALRDYALAIYDYLDSIISLAPGHIFWLDKNNVYLGCNQEQAKNVGLASRRFIIGKTNADLPWAEQAINLDEVNREVMNSGKTIVIEESVDTINGYRTYLSAKVPLRDSRGEVIGLLGTALDITEQKHAMSALAEAKQKAEEASWAKSEFIQNMSHDLKTPIMTIMGMAEVLEHSEEDEERKKFLMMIHNAGKRMLDVFVSILDVASLEAGQVMVKHEPIDLRDILQGLQELYQPLIIQKGLILSIEVATDVPESIMSDHMRVQRILLNLIGNALKFTQEGSVAVNVHIERASDQSKLLVLTVTDTGIGIPTDKLELIFEKFVRLSSSYEGKYTGTGLGLGIVKRFTEELQGNIYVESKQGIGTVFICKLPLV